MSRVSVIIISLIFPVLLSGISFRAKKHIIFAAHKKSITSISFTNDGKYILTSSNDMSIKLWNTNGKLYRAYKGHGDWVNAAVFSENQRLIASASADKTIRIWNRYTGKTIKRIKVPGAPADKIIFTDNDKRIISLTYSSLKLTVFDIKSGKIRSTAKLPGQGYLMSAYFFRSGKFVAYEDKGLPVIYDIAKRKVTKRFSGSKHTAGIKSFILTPDLKKLVTGGGSNVNTFDCTIKVWDMKSLKEVKTITGHDSDIYLASTSSSKYLIAASTDRTIRIWDIIKGKEITKLSAKYEAFWCAAVSKNNTLIAGGSVGGYVAIFKNTYF
jgi:WD40 repeat protein